MTKHAVKTVAIILSLALSISLFPAAVFADNLSSPYIFMTSASLSQGSSAGKICVNYSITGMGRMDSIGVSSIAVYKSNGTLYTTIYGSVANGLIKTNTMVATGSYEISCTAGYSYYCDVTLIASKDGGYDTRTIQTGTVVAPSSP